MLLTLRDTKKTEPDFRAAVELLPRVFLRWRSNCKTVLAGSITESKRKVERRVKETPRQGV